ncbi:MAG: hypothetical protein H7330_14170, partial [Hymenobacteraceae bacterium]|nr:hypothetical protein [Hymenobacteraceae bacterium]
MLPLAAHGQTYFNERYSNPTGRTQTAFLSIAPTDSGYVAVGTTRDYPTAGEKALTLRFLTPTGQQDQAYYSYGRLSPGWANAFHRLPDGRYVLVGQRTVPGTFRGYTVLLRFNAIGDTLWTRRFARGSGESGLSMCVLPDGGFAIIGSMATGTSTDPFQDIVLTRTDSAGNLLWWKKYDNLIQDYGWTITSTADGGFLLGGYSYDLTQTDSFVVKTDSLGNRQWQRTFGSPTLSDGLTAVCALRDGTYLLASSYGTRVVAGTTQYRHIVYHLDSAGGLLSSRRYGPEGDVQELYVIHELADGSVVIAGQQSDSTPAQMPEAVIFKLCPDGEEVWYRTYKKLLGPNSHNYLRDLRPTPDGGFVAAGFLFANPPDLGSSDGWVFKVDSAGYVQAGGAVVTNPCRPVGLGEAGAGPAREVAVWPNPAADGRFTVRVGGQAAAGGSGAARATLTVCDALGRVLLRQPAGGAGAETRVDLSAQPPGLYLL